MPRSAPLTDGRLGSFSDDCMHLCICPIVVVGYPDVKDGVSTGDITMDTEAAADTEVELHSVPELEQEYHNASNEHKGKRGMFFCQLKSSFHR
uniref:Uncharacterized protein n=1 Tax=Nelumbo nucifera TaxID=4432 RepID=A0A822YZ48_NELNU|nr:TPA_asm: hypothetical protein HUJ06_008154 [Nelumbo nucifera]